MMNRLLYVLPLVALLFVSCDKGNIGPLYEKGTSEEAGISFNSSVLSIHLPVGSTYFDVPVVRGDISVQTATVKFSFDTTYTGSAADSLWVDEDPDGIFSLSASRVVFRDETLTSYARINVSDIEKMSPSMKYKMRLSLKGREDDFRNSVVTISVSRLLDFSYYCDCMFLDNCIFENSYRCKLYKAEGCEVYRLMDPYSEGLQKEEYYENSCAANPPAYVEFSCDALTGLVSYEPFYTGMLVPTGATVLKAYAYHPASYKTSWGRDFSAKIVENYKVSDGCFHLCPVYCLPDLSYGYLNEGAYELIITKIEE